jgi:hypothetical protein
LQIPGQLWLHGGLVKQNHEPSASQAGVLRTRSLELKRRVQNVLASQLGGPLQGSTAAKRGESGVFESTKLPFFLFDDQEQ